MDILAENCISGLTFSEEILLPQGHNTQLPGLHLELWHG
jgi:hypothetical protein